jgi:hypothetical protein
MQARLAISVFLVALCAPIAVYAEPGVLPDHSLTPGVTRPTLTQAAICQIKWGKDARHVTAAMKRQVFAEYGLSGNHDPFCQPKGCEIDHLISRELGGADDVRNLWPESYAGPWNAHMKDRLENRLHKEVCGGRLTLKVAREGIAGDWIALYRQYFGAPMP